MGVVGATFVSHLGKNSDGDVGAKGNKKGH